MNKCIECKEEILNLGPKAIKCIYCDLSEGYRVSTREGETLVPIPSSGIYLVGLKIGGIMEHPHIIFEDIQEIKAISPKEAEDIYNKLNDCSYYYGKVVGNKEIGRIVKDDSIIHNSFC